MMEIKEDTRVFKYGSFLHKFIGIWPDDDQFLGKFSNTKRCIVAFIALAVCCFQFSSMWQAEDTNTLLDNLIDSIATIFPVIKILPILYNRDTVLELITMTDRINKVAAKDDVKPKGTERWQGYEERLIKFCLRVYPFVVGAFFICAPVFTDKHFPLQGILPRVALIPPWYQLFYLMESLMIIPLLIAVLSSDVLAITLICHLCNELEILQYSVNKISKRTKRNLSFLVRRHAYALDYGEKICQTYSKIFLFQHLIYSSFICLSGIITLNVDNSLIVTKVIFITFVLIMTMFIICFVGDVLTNSSLEIAKAIENSDYASFMDDVPLVKSVSFILCRSQKPLRIPVGCHGCMNLKFFSETMNKVVSFFMILNTMIG